MARSRQVLDGIDQQFNPCRGQVAGQLFRCDAQRNYLVDTAQYPATIQRFLGLVKQANESYLQALSEHGPTGRSVVDAIRTASMVNTTIEQSGLLRTAGSSSPAPAPSADLVNKIHPTIAIMFNQLPRIQEYFQITIGTQPGIVVDSDNPNDVASRIGTGPVSTGFGLAGTPYPTDTPTTSSPSGGTPVTYAQVSDVQPNLTTSTANQKFWTQDPKDPTVFTNDAGWRAKAVNSAGHWSYQIEHYKQPHSIQFRNAEQLVGGAGAKTMVEYTLGEKESFETHNKVQQFQDRSGNILGNMNGSNQWIKFESKANIGQVVLKPQNTASRTDSRLGTTTQQASQPLNIQPFQFTMPKNGPTLVRGGQLGHPQENLKWYQLQPHEKPRLTKNEVSSQAIPGSVSSSNTATLTADLTNARLSMEKTKSSLESVYTAGGRAVSHTQRQVLLHQEKLANLLRGSNPQNFLGNKEIRTARTDLLRSQIQNIKETKDNSDATGYPAGGEAINSLTQALQRNESTAGMTDPNQIKGANIQILKHQMHAVYQDMRAHERKYGPRYSAGILWGRNQNWNSQAIAESDALGRLMETYSEQLRSLEQPDGQIALSSH